jgi:hypothetical protein
MAVRALSRSQVRSPAGVADVPASALALTLVTPAADLFGMLQPASMLGAVGLVATAAAAIVLLLLWVRAPRTAWLLAATLASGASLLMRLMGVEVAPALSLLAVVALGVGGAFGSPALSAAEAA